MADEFTGLPRADQKRWRANNPDRFREQQKAYFERLWQKVLDAYGRRCDCCGETEELFLTIDHVHGRPPGHTNRRVVLLAVQREGFPDSYRILCFNCNCGRERNDGVCPHEEERLLRRIA